jgi:glycine dehydrogenase subunit 2
VRSFYGNFGVAVKAYAYILSMGAEGLKQAAQNAVLNANYVQSQLREKYDLPYDTVCMHETVLSGKRQGAFGVTSLDIAKRLIDYGYHPPTMYFPMIVKEALMIEPTETESKETLDGFIEAMLQIADEADKSPELLKTAPNNTALSRMDEARAVRQPVLKYQNR